MQQIEALQPAQRHMGETHQAFHLHLAVTGSGLRAVPPATAPTAPRCRVEQGWERGQFWSKRSISCTLSSLQILGDQCRDHLLQIQLL